MIVYHVTKSGGTRVNLVVVVVVFSGNVFSWAATLPLVIFSSLMLFV